MNDLVIYEIFPASFADSNGDGLGDLNGVTQKADYIAALGVNAVWLTPFYPSASYHGYSIIDYCAVRDTMGTLADFDAMLAALHARGIRVICDMVFNHSSNQHPWFLEACRALAAGEDSPYIGYYTFSKAPGKSMHPVPGAAGWYYLGQFSVRMPDLNLDNPSVRAELESVMKFWLGRGVDGFRLDAVVYYYSGDTEKNTQFLTWLMRTARAVKPDVYIVGEAWTDDAALGALYDSGIDSLFHFSLAGDGGEIVRAVRSGNGAGLARTVAKADFKGTDAPFLSNHDMGRSADALVRDGGMMRAAAAAYLFAPGIPTVYYGEEIGMTGSGRDENKRLPMVWGEAAYTCRPLANADQAQKLKAGVLQQEGDEKSLLSAYRRLIAMRRAHPELSTIRPEAVDTGAPCVYALRYGDTCALVNMSGSAVSIPWSGGGQIESQGGASLERGMLTLCAWAAAIVHGAKA